MPMPRTTTVSNTGAFFFLSGLLLRHCYCRGVVVRFAIARGRPRTALVFGVWAFLYSLGGRSGWELD